MFEVIEEVLMYSSCWIAMNTQLANTSNFSLSELVANTLTGAIGGDNSNVLIFKIGRNLGEEDLEIEIEFDAQLLENELDVRIPQIAKCFDCSYIGGLL